MILQKLKTVDFDPSNPEHRFAVASFMKRTAWGDSKFRFTHDPSYGSVADQVRVKMLHWYITQDTGIAVKCAVRPLVGRGLHAVA
jgi:hypothetical protein